MTGVLWRETIVSEDMVDPLNELARLSGDDIYVKPIKGYGSYTTNKASAGIDTGGGHVDIDLVGLTDEQKLRLERIARMVGFYADIREPKWYSPIRKIWLTAKWQSHLHMIKKDTRDLSDPARKQLNLWYAGFNGLAGFDWNGVYTYDADDGPRQYLRQTWTQYKELIAMGETLTTTTEVPVSGSIARLMGLADGKKWSVVGMIKYANAAFWLLSREIKPMLLSQNKAIAELRGMVAGQTTLINQLATGSDVDVDAIIKATTDAARQGALEGAAAGVSAGIDNLDVVVKVAGNDTP